MNSFILTSHLRTSFRKIGAEVRALPPPRVLRNPWVRESAPQRIRVDGNRFDLLLPSNAEAAVLDCRVAEHHLVLRLHVPGSTGERFLCGFDERHFFAAAVKGSTVLDAKHSLMPPAVRQAAYRTGIRHADFYRRHNRAFVRQGEWFFVPTNVSVNPLTIRYREPLIRPGGGKPHLVDEVARGGAGIEVWYHPTHAPHGFDDEQFEALPENVRKLRAWTRRTRVLNGHVLARGAVRHPDHATIRLRGWHEVHINEEVRPPSLGFLD